MAVSESVPQKYFIGFDLGTSGGRISIIETATSSESTSTPPLLPTSTSNDVHDIQYKEVYNDSIQYTEYDNPQSWNDAIQTLLTNTPQTYLQSTKAICVSGTSASCLMVDYTDGGRVTRHPKMYDYDITTSNENSHHPTAHIQVQEIIDKYVPKDHATRANTSALSKLLHYHYCQPINSKKETLVHQSEYVANTMFLSYRYPRKQCGAGIDVNQRVYTSDWHNTLKLGYDVRNLCYPKWLCDCLSDLGIDSNAVLPRVVSPGEVIGCISSSCSDKFGIHPNAVVVGGTTDSNAAFIAATSSSSSDGSNGSGMPTYGTAVTSLGSTLAIKMLSKTYVENASQGVYSHRFPVFGQQQQKSDDDTNNNDGEEAWLVGGASNVGCAILRKENFSNEELATLSSEMDVMVDTELEYYPLTKRGERFPIADSTKEPILTPTPESRGEYLKGILQGITNVEKKAFEVLGELGSSPSYPHDVWTCGGGSKNDKWIQMRQRILGDENDGVKVMKANNAEASFGAAVLAASSFTS